MATVRPLEDETLRKNQVWQELLLIVLSRVGGARHLVTNVDHTDDMMTAVLESIAANGFTDGLMALSPGSAIVIREGQPGDNFLRFEVVGPEVVTPLSQEEN